MTSPCLQRYWKICLKFSTSWLALGSRSLVTKPDINNAGYIVISFIFYLGTVLWWKKTDLLFIEVNFYTLWSLLWFHQTSSSFHYPYASMQMQQIYLCLWQRHLKQDSKVMFPNCLYFIGYICSRLLLSNFFVHHYTHQPL